MRFSFTEDQRLFAGGLRDLLANECTAAHVRAVWDDGTGHSPALWRHLADLGVLSVLVPEAAGGLGGSLVDAVLLFQELGRAAVPGPVLEHAAVVAPLAARCRELDWAAGTVDGSTVGTTSIDVSPYVAHAHVADVVLTPTGWLRGFEADPVDSIDGGRRLATVRGGVETPHDLDVDRAFDTLAVAVSAYLIGLSEQMIDVAAEYARQREQFGVPIGSFQAVKHLLADALVKVEFAKAPTYRAAWSLATGQPEARRDVSMAKALASDAAYRTSRSALQVHGAIGYTWEADLQLWMKKAWALSRAYGDPAFHRRRVRTALLGI
jgi:alkylation response protein AidB-like acyl-CoA dehydrogenase